MASTREDSGWHLDKRVPVSIIITLVLQAGAGLWFMSKLDSRIAALEHEAATQHDRDDRQDRTTAESQNLLRQQLQRMDDKLDRLLEARRQGPGR